VSVNPTDVGLPGGTGAIVNFQVTSQQRTPWVKSQTQVIDAMRIGVRTGTHFVDFDVMVPYVEWQLNGADLIATPLANGIEVILDAGFADDAWYVEDTDASGLIKGLIEYLVSVPSPSPDIPGPMQTTVIVPVSRIADYTYVQGLLDAARAQLAKVAAS
jgi:hypothetical protein